MYPVMLLQGPEANVRQYVNRLEEVSIRTAADSLSPSLNTATKASAGLPDGQTLLIASTSFIKVTLLGGQCA